MLDFESALMPNQRPHAYEEIRLNEDGYGYVSGMTGEYYFDDEPRSEGEYGQSGHTSNS